MKLGRPRKYPWEEWFDQSRTVLVRGRTTTAPRVRWYRPSETTPHSGGCVRLTDTGDTIIIEVIRTTRGGTNTREVLVTTAKGGTQSKYPWDDWFAPELDKDRKQVHDDGRGVLLLLERDLFNDDGTLADRGKRDFDVAVNAMPAKLRTAARKRYKVCEISRLDPDGKRLVDSLIIRARDMTPDERVAEDLKRTEEAEENKARRARQEGRTAGMIESSFMGCWLLGFFRKRSCRPSLLVHRVASVANCLPERNSSLINVRSVRSVLCRLGRNMASSRTPPQKDC